MAELTLKIATKTATFNASNTKAQTVLNNFLLAENYSGLNTDQAKMDFVVAHLVKYLTRIAQRYQAKIQSEAAVNTAMSDVNNAFEA